MTSENVVRLGTRGSALARWQANWITERLQQLGVEVQQVLITTQGDVQSGPIGSVGEQGVFTKEIQRALLDKEVDLAVHSLKDMPTERIEGLQLAAVPARETVADVLITPSGLELGELPEKAVVGTGSMRRRSQLLHVRSDLIVKDIRGNVETRLKKLDDGDYDAIVLAHAGLKRLGLDGRPMKILNTRQMLPAIGQGALGLETRSDDQATLEIVRQLDHRETHACVAAERSLLASLRGGCLAPIAAYGRVVAERLHLDAIVLSNDGQERLAATGEAEIDTAVSLGRQLAAELQAEGADKLIAQSRG